MYVGALPYCNNVPPLDWTATPRRLGYGYASTQATRHTDKPSRVPACGN